MVGFKQLETKVWIYFLDFNLYIHRVESLKPFCLTWIFCSFWFKESGCLLPSLPSDAIFDKDSGISFTCDLNDNIPAPWPSSSQSSASTCKKRMWLLYLSSRLPTFSSLFSLTCSCCFFCFAAVRIPALPAAASSQPGKFSCLTFRKKEEWKTYRFFWEIWNVYSLFDLCQVSTMKEWNVWWYFSCLWFLWCFCHSTRTKPVPVVSQTGLLVNSCVL